MKQLLAGGAVGALALLVVSALVLAGQAVLTRERSVSDPPAPSPVFATIERGAVVDVVNATLERRGAPGVPVRPPVADGIVTRAGIERGAQVGRGTVVAAVAERPVIALEGSLPAYRSLGPADRGPDVEQLQHELRQLGFGVWDPRGEYGASTGRAIARLYQNRGFVAHDAAGGTVGPGGSGAAAVGLGEIVFLPALPVAATNTCGTPGTAAPAELCALRAANGDPVLLVPRADASRVTAKQSATAAGMDGRSVALEVGSPIDGVDDTDARATDEADTRPADDPAESDTDPDADVAFAVTATQKGLLREVPDGADVEIAVARSAASGFRVPAVAVRESGGRRWLERVNGDRIDVGIGLCAAGECEVRGPGVRPGVRVRLPVGLENERSTE